MEDKEDIYYINIDIDNIMQKFTENVINRITFWIEDLFKRHEEYWNDKSIYLESLLNMFIKGYFYGAHEFNENLTKDYLEKITKKKLKLIINKRKRKIRIKMV